MKKILLTMFLILCNVLALSAQNGGAIKGDATSIQRVVRTEKGWYAGARGDISFQ